MTPAALLERFREAGVDLNLVHDPEGARLHCRGSKEVLTPERVETLRQAKPHLLRLLEAERTGAGFKAVLGAAVLGAVGSEPRTQHPEPSTQQAEEERAWEKVRATCRRISEKVSAGAIPWAQEHRPPLMALVDEAEAAVNAAFAERQWIALDAALSRFLFAMELVAAAYRGAKG